MFAVPARTTVTAVVVFAESVRPRMFRVLPAPVAVRVRPELALVMLTGPIVRVVPVPARMIERLLDAATTPVPRSRLFAAVLARVPKVSGLVRGTV